METGRVEDARISSASLSLHPRLTRKEMLDKNFESENNQLVKMMKSPHVETILQVRGNPSFLKVINIF